ncbi:hypothetical protein BC830DRAFT_409883 [Chytriomyces sp. MP71]|nr:hypothetical protein BC830DRAFT_409883 [Chytriomyces sp. MP71]
MVLNRDSARAADAPNQLSHFLSTLQSPPEPETEVLELSATQRYEQLYLAQKARRLLPKQGKGPLQRDSQAQRLKQGKDGSRRRRRKDNDTFADHPLIKGFAPSQHPLFQGTDLRAGPCMPQPPAVFSVLPGALRNSVSHGAVPPPAMARTTAPPPHGLSKADRAAMGRGLRRWGKGRAGDVKLLEEALRFHFGLAVRQPESGLPSPVMSDDVGAEELKEADAAGWELVEVSQVDLEMKELSVEDLSISEESGSDGEAFRFHEPLLSTKAMGMDISALESRQFAWGAKWVSNYATPGFSEDKVSEDGWCSVVPSRNSKTYDASMNLILRDPFLKILVHYLAKFYGLNAESYDCEDSSERITNICVDSNSLKPEKTFVEFFFGSKAL